MVGSSFSGAVKYIVQKQQAKVLGGEGIRLMNVKSMVDDFNMQRMLNPELGKAVGHLVLSWSQMDAPKLSEKILMERAKQYLEKMKIQDTQYLVVEHRDTKHPHIHILYNRVDNSGRSISDKFQRRLNQKVCKEMTLEHGYHLAKDKSQVNRQQLKGADKIRYELSDTIQRASKFASSWGELETVLASKDIRLIYKYKSGTQQVEGISFEKDGMVFKGSKVDRSLSYGRLNNTISANSRRQFRGISTVNTGTKMNIPTTKSAQVTVAEQPSSEPDLIDTLLSPVHQNDPEQIRQQQIKKRKKSRGLHL
ncbi:relaxase/mobilization nuclease domain-containing protein [Dyadobacter sandarakinus]|uniref:Relaxase/mobilization nuclease domain-containing protein n=1 Tax=Dyadobacter sandarakinus TaxID=2747268 RepID=A0ABX7IF50_9BACT|nr:relaxase/mobilization nuclease domain-containing protein [Dyadobacter sandarakinus]